jgi:hypothetical protein
MKIDVAKIIVDLSNPNKTRAAAASADLASQIWAGSIDEATLIQWLESDDETASCVEATHGTRDK